MFFTSKLSSHFISYSSSRPFYAPLSKKKDEEPDNSFTYFFKTLKEIPKTIGK